MLLAKIVEYLSHLEIHIAFSILNILVRFIVLPLLVYPYFEQDIEQDEIKQKTE